MTNLKYLTLNNNQLTGVIPSSIQNLSNLTANNSLRLYSNDNLHTSDEDLQAFINDDRGYSPSSGTTPYEYIINTNSYTQDNALMALYNSTDGEHWTHSDNWDSGHPCEDNWRGVYCNDEGEIIRLYLHSNNLTGTIPPEIGNLTSLKELLLYSNDLTGTIPSEIGNLTSLEGVYLNNNNLMGSIPVTIGNLRSLKYLFLYNNQLTGSIPVEIGNLIKLKKLYLYNNQLTGVIPSSIQNLVNLESKRLKLYDNDNLYTGDEDLQAFINGDRGYSPSSDIEHYAYILSTNNDTTQKDALMALYNSTDGDSWLNHDNWGSGHPCGDEWHGVECNNEGEVTSLSLNSNNLVGTIPTAIGDLTSLEYLSLSNNRLTGVIPSSIKNLVNLTTNRSLKLYDNSNLYTNDTTLQTFINEDRGYSPSSDTTSYEYILSTNGYMKALVALYNSTKGESWTHNDNWNNGEEPCDNENRWYGVTCNSIGEITSLDLHNNNLIGTIPYKIYELTSLTTLKLDNNQLRGSIPRAIWHSLTSLITLKLNNNQLTGSIPTEIEDLVNLELLYLYNNKLTGVIPSSIKNFNNLTSNNSLRLYNNDNLHTSDTDLQNFINADRGYSPSGATPYEYILNTNSYIQEKALRALYNSTDGEHWTHHANWNIGHPCMNDWYGVGCNDEGEIISLILNDNNLVGIIPTVIGDLTSLEYLYLPNNQLTGSIPSEIGNMTSLYYLYLYSNQLEGSIPTEIGDLTHLNELLLSNNKLTGTIPSSIASLNGLDTLYLHNNCNLQTSDSELQSLINRAGYWHEDTAPYQYILNTNTHDCSNVGALVPVIMYLLN